MDGDFDKNEKSNDHELQESARFQAPVKRRDFLGLAAVWTALSACAFSIVGMMRLPMPSVFPESDSKVKIGFPDTFPKGSATHLSDFSLWVFHDEEGLYAISSICTHLGCVAVRETDGRFRCPCHGSVFDPIGKVMGGPAPKGLNWLKMDLSHDGQIVVDQIQNVAMGTRLEWNASETTV